MEIFFSGLVHYFIPFLIILSILVFVHEFGHYWVAKKCGVKIEAFAIGFGRELFGFTDKSKTRWKFCLIPFGGYVKMFGDADPASSKQSTKKMTKAEKAIAFHHKKVWQRALIVFAGPLFNYIFAVVALAVLFMSYGQPYTSNQVSELVEGGPAAVAGIEAGDKILSLNDRSTPRFEDIRRIVQLNPGVAMTVEVQRGEEVFETELTTEAVAQPDSFGDDQNVGRIGILSKELERVQHNPVGAVWAGVVESYNLTMSTFNALGQIISGARSADEIGGPLRIAKMSGDVAEAGFATALFFTALLSINLGLINLFPIPVLDGGHLLFYAIETVAGKPPSYRVQELSSMVGISLVLLLMAFATWNDLSKLNVFEYITNLIS